MNPSILRITIDLQRYDKPLNINVGQGNTACKLAIALLDGGKPYVIGEGGYATFQQITESGAVVYASTECKNNVVELTLPNASTAEVGVSECELGIYAEGSNEALYTPHLSITVHATLLHEFASNVIASDSFEILNQTINNAQTLISTTENKLANGEFDGDSAYEVAKKNGFEGTEAEWLESLKVAVAVVGKTLILN